MTTEGQDYNIAAIRKLLTAAFMDSRALRRFCQSHRDLRPVLQLVNEGASQQDHVDVLISYCEAHLLFRELLAGVEQVNPRQYKRFAPYTPTGRRTVQRDSGDKSAWRWTLLAASIVAVLFIGGLLYVFWPRSNGPPEPTPTSTLTLTPTATATVQTPTLTASATVQTPTLTASATAPSATPSTSPTNTPLPPTDTPETVTVALETTNDRYVTAMDGSSDPPWVLRAETKDLLDCEKFTLLCQGDVQVALQTCHKTETGNRYVTALGGDHDHDWLLIGETDVPLDYEKFTLLDADADAGEVRSCQEVINALKENREVRVAFQTYHMKEEKHRLVTAMDVSWDWVLRAETTELGESEKFTMIWLP